VIRAADLDDAIRIQNEIPYGLTAGLFSLDDDEIARWQDQVEAGNLYINRQITGAIVQRQPFGGWKRSAIGPGIKAGGPFYVASMGTWGRASGAPWDAGSAAQLASRAIQLWEHWSVGTDPSGLRSEQNLLRLRAIPHGVVLRAGRGTTEHELSVARTLAQQLGVTLQISTEDEMSDGDFAELAATGGFDRVRVIGAQSPELLAQLAQRKIDVDLRQISANPAMELLCWTREQAISRTLHRHGNPRPIR
jgi:RHH-type proline utilization regulon transcriptional repressor/proline dehydrogenase/delta 1-pyrroline-5-carboxylate dehydrogenase